MMPVRLILGLATVQPILGRTHLIVVAGLAGEAQYQAAFLKQGGALVDAAKQRWELADSGVVYLAENPAADPARITGKATREGVLAAVTAVARRARPNDLVILILLGHGSQQTDSPQLNLPGPDLTAADLAAALTRLRDQTLVLVNTTSASGGFLPILAGPRRIVITATKTGLERNVTMFGDMFVKGLVSEEADADKDSRVSVAEAYSYARQEVARAYQSSKRLQTEHAQIDDTGDGIGVGDIGQSGDGGLARTVSFGLRAEPTSADPAVVELVAKRRGLEREVSALRARKATMDSTGYQRELERLLIALAETNQLIRRTERRQP